MSETATTARRLKKGFEFQHSRVLDQNNKPMIYVITRIARGTVYYRPVSGGGVECCDVDHFGRRCAALPFVS